MCNLSNHWDAKCSSMPGYISIIKKCILKKGFQLDQINMLKETKRKSLKNKKKKKAEPPVSVIVDNPKRDMLALFFTALSLLALAIEHRSFVTSSTADNKRRNLSKVTTRNGGNDDDFDLTATNTRRKQKRRRELHQAEQKIPGVVIFLVRSWIWTFEHASEKVRRPYQNVLDRHNVTTRYIDLMNRPKRYLRTLCVCDKKND